MWDSERATNAKVASAGMSGSLMSAWDPPPMANGKSASVQVRLPRIS
jgi:hypothetical protein